MGRNYCMGNNSTTITVVINVLYRHQIIYIFYLRLLISEYIEDIHPCFYVLLVPLCYKYRKYLKASWIVSCPKMYILGIFHLWYSLILIFFFLGSMFALLSVSFIVSWFFFNLLELTFKLCNTENVCSCVCIDF